MISTRQLLRLHEQGRFSSTDVMLNVLAQTNKRNVVEMLPKLSPVVLQEMEQFVGYYSPKVEVFHGPRPNMPMVRFVAEWFAKSPVCHCSEKVKPLRTVTISCNMEFDALNRYSDSVLCPKGYKRFTRNGSTSWVDRLVKPRDKAVRFKLCNFEAGIFFGVREQWAKELRVPLERIGTLSLAAKPSRILFRGDYVTNSPSGRGLIERLVALFP